MSSIVATAAAPLPLPTARPDDPALQGLLERLPVAAYVCDAAGQITFFNDAAAAVWGRRPALNTLDDRYCGSVRLFSTAGEPIPHDACWAARALADGVPYDEREMIVERADGSRRFVLAFAHPLSGADGSLAGSVNVLVDITGRHEGDPTWRMQSEAKDRFIAVLSHELRNPLAPIRSAVELLRRIGGVDRLADDAIDVIDRQVALLTRLIDDLMDLSRISRDKLVLRIAPVDLRAAVRDAVESVRPLIDAKQHTLTIGLPEQPLMLHGDATRLAQAIGNVLHNAAKFTPPDGRIAIDAVQSNGWIEVRIRDDGVGVAPADARHVFDMFVQSEARAPDDCGLGIGLPLTRRLVEMHGGTVALDSEGSGHGTLVTLSLPLADRANLLRPRIGLATRIVCRPLRLLVVDDNEDAARWLAALLQLDGHTVRCAANGAEALESVRGFVPHVALIDIGMPGLSGHDLARELRARHGRACMLVAVTGYGQVADRQRSAQAGFEHHLVKPIDAHALSAMLAARAQDRMRDIAPPSLH